MTRHTKYRSDITPPLSIIERMRAFVSIHLRSTTTTVTSKEEAEDQACYALEAPAIIPLGSHYTDNSYSSSGWRRTLVIRASMAVAVREA